MPTLSLNHIDEKVKVEFITKNLLVEIEYGGDEDGV